MLRNLLFILIFNISLVSASFAERNIDLITGTISTGNTEVYAENRACIFCGVQSATRNVSFEDDSYPGIRATFWSEENPYLGGAVELSFYVLSDKQSIDIDITSFSLQGLLREGFITSSEFPHGRLQPYIGAGFFFIFADANVNFTPDISSTFGVSGKDYAVGILYGVRFQFTENLSMFIELRDISFNANFDEDDESFNLSPDMVRMKLDSKLNLVGLSWKF